MASLQPSWFSSPNLISRAKPSLLSSQFKPIKLLWALNPENAESSETTPESQPGPVDPVKLAFSKAKAYRESLKSNSDLKVEQNIASSSVEKLNRNDGLSSGQNVVDDGGQKEVPMSLKIAMEKPKKYKETSQGLQGGKEGSARSNIGDNSVGEKGQLSVSKMDFIGLEFADKKQTRGLPPGLVPISDSFSSSDMPEVELIVGDTSQFGAATTAPKPEQTEEDESDLYKPKVSTWGVFPRPRNISKTYGGGKVIRPGDALETEEEKSAKEERTKQLLAAYKNKIGLNIDPKLKSECEEALKEGDSLMNAGKLKEALPFYEKVMEKLTFKSELHGLAALQWSVCQDSLSRSNEARLMYEKLQSHPSPKVSKKARHFVFSFQAMEMMKVTTGSPFSLNAGYQNYFDAFVEKKSNYTLQEDLNVQERAINQVLPYLLFLISPIFMLLLSSTLYNSSSVLEVVKRTSTATLYMAGALVGGAFLSAFLQVAFDRLASPHVLDFFKKPKLNQTLLNKLKIVLLSIDAVVDDAERKQITNPKVKDWIEMVKDAVFDAEDVLDEIDYEMCKRKLEAEQKSQTSAIGKVRNFFSAPVNSFEKEIESKMRSILENLEYLASQRDILRLNERDGGSGMRNAIPNRLPTTSLVDEDATYGRDDDKHTIIEWLLSEKYNSQLSVISIVGMGGLGKTTLAQLVYNDRRVMDEFNLKVWVCVSDEFDVLRVTRTIYEAITGSKDDTNDLNMLQIKLKQQLTQKRFLLVLDDVWNENYMLWEALQSPFNHGALGSKILLTTRSGKVASTMRSTRILPLKPLSEGDSWSLFSRYAFHDENVLCSNFDLEEIGRKISKKCKGLPLALKAIGSLLYTELSHEQWNDILKSEVWEEKSDSEILPALRLSYCHLPSHLKRCFAYSSIFPKDYDFDKQQLIQLWMAENFLTCAHQSKDAREVGEQLFHELLLRSLFQRSTADETLFVMHDLINDMAKVEYGKFCHRLEVDDVHNLSKMTRHISFLRNNVDTSTRFEVMNRANKLRTFLPLSWPGLRITSNTSFLHFISPKFFQNLPSKFSCMRFLSLRDHLIFDLPESIGSLKHLHYLDLSGTRIRELPDSVCQLHLLQTLKLWRCHLLEKLPMNFHKLINLRHLDFRETQVREMPQQLDKLKRLKVLSSFIIDKSGETNLKLLEGLNLHGSISISKLQNVISPSAASAVNLRSKVHLKELTLEWCIDHEKSQHDKGVLENFQPHQNLKKLSIGNYGGTEFPNWLADHSLSNLVSLELRNCKYCISLPSLGLFPSLKSLSIIGFHSIIAIGPEYCGNGSNATSLEILRLGDMNGWEEWKCETMALTFPHLRELSIENCPKLKGQLPQQLPSLRTLVICNCGKLLSSIPRAPSLDKLVLRDCGNEQLDSLPSTLRVLDISGFFEELLSDDKIENMISNCRLEELKFSDCPNLEFPLCYGHNFILEMEIGGSCDSLKHFPLDLFPNLQLLKLIDCNNLEMISVSVGHRYSLTSLFIRKCPKFVYFPEGGFLAPGLVLCSFEDLKNLKLLPEKMHILFPSLTYLLIKCCPQVESLPEGGFPSGLMCLDVSECPKLVASRMGWNLSSLTSLKYFWIGDVDDKSLPDIGLLPPTLISLMVQNCPNLTSLEHKGLCHLSSLEVLIFRGCPKLQYFPKEGLPSSLCKLWIRGCPLLKKQIQKQKGKYWAKSSHIPLVSFEAHGVSLSEILTFENTSVHTFHSSISWDK
ncbi:hypothetical protein K1719_013572 [Acacia pycnantha]|nr:hypothetical protein K1719_013572 [Acacia pycnantha]